MPAVSSCAARSVAGATRAALLMLRAVLSLRKRPVFFGVAIYAFASIVGSLCQGRRSTTNTARFGDLFSGGSGPPAFSAVAVGVLVWIRGHLSFASGTS